MKYKFIEDPGHGWLEVERLEIERLCLEDQISRYSYVRGAKVYLEEDCDADVFIRAKTARGETVETVSVYQENTPIRNYESWGNL